jgi:hypothetical protein
MTLERLLPCAGLLASLAPATAAAFPGLHVIYGSSEAARAIHDGTPDLPGLAAALRQAPVRDDVRWPPARRIGKVGGRALSRLGPAPMAHLLQAGWADPRVGGLVGVDELTARDWTPERSRALRVALGRLGPDARRVVLYVSPGLVSQIGRVDLRLRLSAPLAELLATLREAGAVQLETYHGDGEPFSRSEFAEYATRWLARWAPADPGKLHLLLGRADRIGQEQLWSRARSTPAGRTILANGAGSYGLRSAAEGRDWLQAYRLFAAQPTAPPPEGDADVPVGGGLSVSLSPGRESITVTLSRRARAVVRLVPLAGMRRRVIAKLHGPTPPAGLTTPLPDDLRPGRYRIITVALGDGLRDVSNVALTVPRTRDRASVRQAAAS